MDLLTPTFLIASIITPQVIWGLLWGGLAVITLSILILMQTRWGQAKPMSKCVVLSIFAHLLLIGYAHTTQMFDQQPANETKLFEFKLSNVSFEMKETEKKDNKQEEAKPWNTFATSDYPETSSTAIDPLERKPAESQSVAEVKSQIPSAQITNSSLPQTAKLNYPKVADNPTEPGLKNGQLIDQVNVSVAEIKQPVHSKESVPVQQKESLIPDLARATIGPSVSEMVKRFPSVKPITSNLDASNNIQSLTQSIVTERPAEAIAGEDDRLKQSDNQLKFKDNQASQSRVADSESVPKSSNQFISQRSPAVVMPSEEQLFEQFAKGSIPTPSTDRRLMNEMPLPLAMQARVAENQTTIIESQGGNPQIEASIKAALIWLVSNQTDDGSWDASQHGSGKEKKNLGHDRYGAGANADSGITGLAVLAFLAKGHSHLEGKHRSTVQHGLEYIVNNQSSNGSLAGEARMFAQMYCHGMALLALSEAYAMTRDERLRPFLDSAIAYTVSTQHQTTGGWRYQPGDIGDMSQFGWQVMALHSAHLAGIEVPEKTQLLMARFLNDASSGQAGGLGSYRKGEKVTAPMTAEALVCRVFLQQYDDEETLREASNFIARFEPGPGKMNLYYWYYATLGLHQLQDENWNRWSSKIQSKLMATQQLQGPNTGSWKPDTEWGNYGGRVYSTALATLSLEVYFRYLPLYKGSDAPRRLPVASRMAAPIRVSSLPD
ncbi:MAG: prenyltransferase/squalene oxidase repeat-containing protein [Pirellulales bacterium]